ncbi:MAG: hypothetical protein V7707_10435 [Motiliproteus sp.]
MRLIHFVLLQCLLVVAVGAVAYIHKDRLIVLKKPPESLAQWYKPDNKRQVWLHTMFNLRREMQAVRAYAASNDAEHLAPWVEKLAEHYQKISEMVPEWQKKLDLQAMADLQASVEGQRFAKIPGLLDQINNSCDSCHEDFQAVTAMRYRVADFSALEVAPQRSSNEHMQTLIGQINQIKIAAVDGMPEVALTSLAELTEGMNTLGGICVDCHEQDKKTYPSPEMEQTIAKLDANLRTGTLKQQGRELGSLAVQACARCHGTHRLAYGMTEVLSAGTQWRELLAH